MLGERIDLQQQSYLDVFGSASERVALAIGSIICGEGVIIVDDEDRENEGDMIFSAEALTVDQMALMIREGSGIVCLVLTDDRVRQLQLPPMVTANTSRHGTAFTVSIEASRGVSSGVSAADRVTTIRAATKTNARPEDLARPGHVFPLRAHPQGLRGRRGHTEATIELMRLSGQKPAGVLCEVMNADGQMTRGQHLIDFAKAYAMPVVSIADIVAYLE